jgi:hypothetical protein
MRRIVACSVAITLLATVPESRAVAASAPRLHVSSSSTVPDRSVVDRLVFDVPLERFRSERSRERRRYRWLITATDGCSAPIVGSGGRSFDFRLACERHDLAYANYRALHRLGLGVSWDAALRSLVDDQFQRDLQQSCTSRRHSERLRCDTWAVVYFHAVRLAAGP